MSAVQLSNKPKGSKMKKLINWMVVAALVAIAGCTPSEEQIKTTATAIGYAAGLVADETPIKDEARNAVVEVLNEVRACIPADGQSFAQAWEPVIKEKVAELVEAGKIDAATGELVTTVALMAAKGVDYLFDVRFPKAKQYAELVAAGTSGAIDGFLAVFKPANERAAIERDEEAYRYFKANK